MSDLSEEEIIEILEDTIKNLRGEMEIKHTNYNKEKAIQGLLDLYNKEKEKNKLQEKTLIEFAEEREKILKTPVISEDKIKEKIEKYKHKDFIKLQLCYQHDNEAVIKVKAYEELLEEE